MSSRYPVPGDEGGSGVQRLLAAVEERRARDARESASGAHVDLETSASLQPAAEVVARERWLKAVDEHDY